MTYVVTGGCIRCKFTDCVSVCPVDCFREGANMLVIAPDECIDCSVCVPECPEDAIVLDTDPRAGEWVARNARYAADWPAITSRVEPPPDADAWKGRDDKDALFDPRPALRGDA